MANAITIEPARGVVVVRAGGAVLGESRSALVLMEPGRDPVYYIPRGDFSEAFLEPSETRTSRPHMGDATWFGIIAKSGPIADAVWSYETPESGVAQIAGMLAFDTERVAVELL